MMIRIAAVAAVAAVAVALATLGPAPAQAETRQFGDLIYPIPEGWDTPSVREGRVVMYADLPEDRCEFCQLMIGPEAPKQGGLIDWMTKNRLAMVDEDERDAWKPLAGTKPITGDRYPMALMSQTDGDDVQMLLGIEAGQKYFLVGFEGQGEDDLNESLAVASETLVPWVSRMQFVSAGVKPLLPRPVAGDLDGLYWGWHVSNGIGLDGMMTMDNEYRRIVFWPDGTFYEGMPPEGLKAPDRAALTRARDLDWGNYAVRGGTLKLLFADGRSDALSRDGDGWKDDDQTLGLAKPARDGAVIDGRIEWISFTGLPAGGGTTGGISSGGETVFHPNGTYEGSSFGGAFGSYDGGGGFAVNSPSTRGGTYEVRDGLVISTPKGGGAPSAAMLFATPQGELMVGDDFLEGTVK